MEEISTNIDKLEDVRLEVAEKAVPEPVADLEQKQSIVTLKPDINAVHDETLLSALFPEKVWINILSHLDPRSKEAAINASLFFRRVADRMVPAADVERSVVSLNPGNDANDKTVLLAIFPEEVWVPILSHLDVRSKEAASNASSFFRRILGPSQTVFLFPQVWEVLGLQFEGNIDQGKESPYNDHPKKPRPDGYTPKKPHSGVLKLRSVCKDWCSALDAYYDEVPIVTQPIRYSLPLFAPEPIQSAIRRGLPEPWAWARSAFSLENPHPPTFEEFVAKVDELSVASPRRNPLIGRQLCLGFCPNPECTHIAERNRFTPPLVRYGHQIWHLEIVVLPTPHFNECVSIIAHWFTLLPNLKTLEITNPGRYESQTWTELELHPLRQHLENVDFPRLANLKCVKFFYIPKPLIDAILHVNNHVETILTTPGLPSLNDIPYPNLRHLALKINISNDSPLLSSPSLRNCPLETLIFDVDNDSSQANALVPDLVWTRALELLERWAGSLTHLLLRIPVAPSNPDIDALKKGAQWMVSHLMLVTCYLSTLDYLLPMRKNLKRLEITLVCNKDTHDHDEPLAGCVINFSLDNVYGSNIWKEFPKLEKIVVITLTHAAISGQTQDLGLLTKTFYRQVATLQQVN